MAKEEWVEVREEYYRSNGVLRHRISCGNATLYDNWAMHFFQIITPNLHVHLDMMSSENAKRMYKAMQSSADVAGKYFFDPPTSLVKEGPKAIVKWSSPCTTL